MWKLQLMSTYLHHLNSSLSVKDEKYYNEIKDCAISLNLNYVCFVGFKGMICTSKTMIRRIVWVAVMLGNILLTWPDRPIRAQFTMTPTVPIISIAVWNKAYNIWSFNMVDFYGLNKDRDTCLLRSTRIRTQIKRKQRTNNIEKFRGNLNNYYPAEL